ncbi:MAG: hypothetical protein UU93_C0002G0048 [Candidatus Amesbacteria bacterium GW2011_GWA2_42_12]|uniref:Uncharacterized protein n=1 Tax=Candidatus Amesbacteria bacterium GW2011_GWA2_42_12 TaxID=1618356 RepID=A0A0G0Y8S8_9BACT|nr:MAG: hypothetical protein UU93_C0002G0048 [Candidatus Amesbacteria bacterium GW2011_GWA2_42_12]
MGLEVKDRDIEDLAKLEVTFDPRRVTTAAWALFMAAFRKLFWVQNVSNDLHVMAANDALADIQGLEGRGGGNGEGKHYVRRRGGK